MQHPFDEMKAYVGFDEADAELLTALWPHVEPHQQAVVDHFYEVVLRFPNAAAVFREPAQVERLKQTLKQWMKELLLGPHDHAYYERRERIGRVHVEVGLLSMYMFTSMTVMRDDLCDVARQALEPETARQTCRALQRISELDLAIMTGTYIERREQQQLASLQELIVSHMPVTVLLLDATGRVLAATRPSARLFGDVGIEGRSYTEAFPTALVEAAELEKRVERAIDTGRQITVVRVDAPIEGETRSFAISVVPLEHPLARALLHVEELTETVAAEARLRRSEALAQLGSMSAAVAHELRNPLAGISGAIQVIARTMEDDDRRRPIMEKVEAQVQRLNALVTDLLAFARPVQPRIGVVDLLETTSSVRDLVAQEHPDVDVALEGRGRARADANMVHQILLNLAQNAAAAAGEGGRVRLAVGEGRVAVEDSGPGVPEDVAERIFQPFFTTRTRGTGLGLAISDRLARSMHGRVALAEPGTLPGARFVLELPRVR